MALRFVDPQAVGRDRVSGLETRLGVTLPASYVDLLTHVSNGGEVEPTGPVSHPEVGLIAMFGVARDDDLDLENRLRECEGRLQRGVLPIADAEGGNLVCLSVRELDYGTVWFWDHEVELSDESLTVVGESLHQFLDDLGPLPDTEDLPEPTEAWIDPDFLLEAEGGRSY